MNDKNIIQDEARKRGYLCIVPDDIVMTREYFAGLLKRFRHYRSVSFGFSKKHTADIMAYRKKVNADASCMPSNLYSVPIEWNVEFTYAK